MGADDDEAHIMREANLAAYDLPPDIVAEHKHTDDAAQSAPPTPLLVARSTLPIVPTQNPIPVPVVVRRAVVHVAVSRTPIVVRRSSSHMPCQNEPRARARTAATWARPQSRPVRARRVRRLAGGVRTKAAADAPPGPDDPPGELDHLRAPPRGAA